MRLIVDIYIIFQIFQVAQNARKYNSLHCIVSDNCGYYETQFACKQN